MRKDQKSEQRRAMRMVLAALAKLGEPEVELIDPQALDVTGSTDIPPCATFAMLVWRDASGVERFSIDIDGEDVSLVQAIIKGFGGRVPEGV